MIDMHNRTVRVTGANSGVGFVTAKQLAEAGAEIVMVCRDPGRGEAARAQLAEIAAGPAPQLFIADLSSQEQIRDVARDLHVAYDRMDVLLNNAGSVFNKGARSIDGIEKTFATNHLAPFLLTNLLQDLLLAAPAAVWSWWRRRSTAASSTSRISRASAATTSSRPTSNPSSAASCLRSSWGDAWMAPR
jgi:NAD(P)-dependent dehydrogenase (short-subunit alcohol dehydrogenase family)